MCLWVLTCPRCVVSLEPQGNGLNSVLKGVSLCLEREGAEHSGSWNLAPPSGFLLQAFPLGALGQPWPLCTGAGSLKPHMVGGGGGCTVVEGQGCLSDDPAWESQGPG